jgi:hypothetical protein
LHIRRTLDQFYYCTLEGTEPRDTDQVTTRYFEDHFPDDKEKKVLLMVDQMWLWVLDASEDVRSDAMAQADSFV